MLGVSLRYIDLDDVGRNYPWTGNDVVEIVAVTFLHHAANFQARPVELKRVSALSTNLVLLGNIETIKNNHRGIGLNGLEVATCIAWAEYVWHDSPPVIYDCQ